MKDRILFVVAFFVLVFTSPLTWQILAKPDAYTLRAEKRYSFGDPAFVDEVNTLQGQLGQTPLSPIKRISVNKYVHMLQLVGLRASEGLDAQFLFFSGDINADRSNKMTGVLLLASLPLFFYGLVGLSDKLKWTVFFSLIAVALFAGSYNARYFVVPRIPQLVIMTLVSAYGLTRLVLEKKMKLTVAWIIAAGVEIAKNYFVFGKSPL